MKERKAKVKRSTKEVEILASVSIDGTGKAAVKSSVAFLDHLITSLATHGLFDITITGKGDLTHHIVEDTAITLGECIGQALGDRRGIRRFGYAIVPMDDALAVCSADFVRRPFSVVELRIQRATVEELAAEDLVHFFRSLITSIPCTAHVNVRYGSNDHHKIEAATKGLALTFRQAVERDARRAGSPSSKGVM